MSSEVAEIPQAATRFLKQSRPDVSKVAKAIVLPRCLVRTLKGCDAALQQHGSRAARLSTQGADAVLTAGKAKDTIKLSSVRNLHPFVKLRGLSNAFYGGIDAIARQRGYAPATPPHLHKVAETR